MCSANIPTPKPPPPPPPAPTKMAEEVAPTVAARKKRKAGGYGVDLLTIPMASDGMKSGAQIPGT